MYGLIGYTMSTYITKVMRDGKRVQLEKPFMHGVVIRNYPQIDGNSYQPHIFIPIDNFNDKKMEMINMLGLNCSITRDKGYMVSFPKSRCYSLKDSIQTMETLKPIVQILNRIK